MKNRMLVWSFASLANMDQAIDAIRRVYPFASVSADTETHNVYWCGHAKDVDYVTGICRGVAHATKDGSIG
jgi:hypothetical protein